MNLRIKIIIVAVITALITVILIGFFSFKLIDSHMENALGINQLEVTRSAMKEIDHILEERYRDIQVLAEDEDFEKLLAGKGLIYSIETDETGQQRITEGEQGSDIFQSELLEGRVKLQEHLQIDESWDEFIIIDNEETIVLSTHLSDEGKTIEDISELRQAYLHAQRGEDFVSDVFTSQHGDQRALVYGAPVRDETAQGEPIIGAIIGYYSWDEVRHTLEENKLQNIYLLDEDRSVLASHINNKNNAFDLSKETITQNIDSDEGFLITEHLLYAYASQHDFLKEVNKNWQLATVLDRDIAFEPARKAAFNISILFAAIMATFSIGFIAWLHKIVLTPLENISDTAKSIVGGNLDKRVAVHTNDEIGKLANNFNEMTNSLVQLSEYVKKIIETMPTALIVTDAKGSIQTVNKAALSMLKYKDDDLKNENIMSLFSEKSGSITTLFEEIRLKNQDKKNHIENVREYMKDSEDNKVPVTLSVNILKEEGKASSIIFAAKDVRELTRHAKEKLDEVTPILQKVATGDLSQKIEIPEEDTFTEHFIALNLMIEDFRELMMELREKSEELEAQNEELEETSAELEEAKSNLEQKVQERTKELQQERASLEKKVKERTAELQQLNQNLEEEVAKRTQELQNKVLELERFNKIAVGRELKMVELKKKISQLKQQIPDDLLKENTEE